MKVYCCRLKADPKVYLKQIRLVGESYVPVEDPKDITFSGDLSEMERLVSKYPEFEVCCLEAEPTVIWGSSGVQKMQLQ